MKIEKFFKYFVKHNHDSVRKVLYLHCEFKIIVSFLKTKLIMEKLSVCALIGALSALRCRYEFYLQESIEGKLPDYKEEMLLLAKDYEAYIKEFESYARKQYSLL